MADVATKKSQWWRIAAPGNREFPVFASSQKYRKIVILMRTGNLRQLTASVLGIHSVNGQRTAVMIPEGAIVELVQEPTTDARVVDVFWEGSTLALFAEDLSQRGKAIVPGSNGPVSA